MIRIEPGKWEMDVLTERLQKAGEIGQAEKILKVVFKETAEQLKDKLYSGTKKRYTIKSAVFKENDIALKKSTAGNPGITLTIKGRPPGLRKAYWNHKNTRERSAVAMVLNTGEMKELEIKDKGKTYKAFVTKVYACSKDGKVKEHEGIFQRIPGKWMEGYEPDPKTGKKGREKIKEIMSMSAAKAAEVVYEKKIGTDAVRDMHYLMLKHVNALFGG